ncbi:tetratricopeptide repeat protein [Pseudomonas sp. RL_15y_Pfl2_60]|uniref:tetratricopeptide repeat protein n=1 Tax=Pseudomonas sp. RL_15y_Pfl2_60 TaxID=3088709 RepID=UPI0030DCD8D4
MRTLLLIAVLMAMSGCTRWALDRHLNSAYEAYDKGNCEAVMLELSQAERYSRSRRYIQPEISLLRGQCLERQNLFVDAAQTYQFIISRYPASEYAFRAQARLQTLSELGHKVTPTRLKTTGTAL